MKEKPWHFKLLAVFLLACGLSIPLQVAIMHNLHFVFDVHIILQQIEPMAWGFVLFSFVSAYLMFQASNHLVWAIPSLCLYTGVMNALTVQGMNTLAIVNVAVVTIGFYLPFGLLFMRMPSTVLNDPEKKWWAHPERKKIHLPMLVTAPFNQSFSVNTYDISMGGAFISLDDISVSMNKTGLVGKRSGIKIGDLLTIKIQVGRFSNIYCQGRVVRIQEQPKGEYPGGIGIQFMHIRKRDRFRLRKILGELDRLTQQKSA